MSKIAIVLACLLVGTNAHELVQDTFCLPPYQTTQCSAGQKCPDLRPCPIDLQYVPPSPPVQNYVPPYVDPNPPLAVIDLPFLPPIVIGGGSSNTYPQVPPPPKPSPPEISHPYIYDPPYIPPAPTCNGNFNWGITQSTGYWPHCVTFPSSYGNYPISSCGYYSNGSPTTLYGQNLGGGNIGYGLLYHPSTYNGFIQLDFTQIYAASVSLANIQISTSNTYGSPWYVYGSNTAGVLGTNLLLSGSFELNLAKIPGFSVYKYISIQVGVSNIFITKLIAPCPIYYPPPPPVHPVPTPTKAPIYIPPPPPPPAPVCSGLLDYALTIATGVLPSQVVFYPTNGVFPVTINGFLTNGARTQLYAQITSPDETGLGLVANPYGYYKLWPGAFIQLDFTALYAIPTRPPSFQFSLNSVDYGDSWSIYGSNTLGVLGHELLLTGNCEPKLNTLPGYGTYKYISIIATSGNILLSKLQGVCPPPPAPQVSYHCNCPFYQGNSVQCAYNPDNRINQLCPGQTPCPNCRAATAHATRDLDKAEKAHAAKIASVKQENKFTESATKHEESKE